MNWFPSFSSAAGASEGEEIGSLRFPGFAGASGRERFGSPRFLAGENEGEQIGSPRLPGLWVRVRVRSVVPFVFLCVRVPVLVGILVPLVFLACECPWG